MDLSPRLAASHIMQQSLRFMVQLLQPPMPEGDRAMEFNVGDKVKLRSGGPVMIVSLVVGDPPPWPWPKSGGECQWLVQDELKSAVFDPETLDLVQAAR